MKGVFNSRESIENDLEIQRVTLQWLSNDYYNLFQVNSGFQIKKGFAQLVNNLSFLVYLFDVCYIVVGVK